MYIYQEYPRVMYHATEKPVTVDTPEEREALGEGWEETPAAFDPEPEPKPEPKKRKAKE